ncbi:hypothetical protein [Hippea maritima]|uniref:Uncharacterized protein n=1 Tax=Hippea maritima (strain ATCC 700847 / DSM 10411 / MH2) TaxID=760142 RepID=F2LY38_HIPMA|nr:hypothetical protein [Hippea maritima]AEA34361.1 hypothetical protein Hipma_1405 [Hippea maritima DSM 10411]
MEWVIQKAFENTITTISIIIFTIFLVVGLIVWLYLPFAVLSIKKELVRIRQLLEELKNISLD